VHVPSGLTKGVLVLATSGRGTIANAKDEIAKVTYGSRELTQVSESPVLHINGFGSGGLHAFWAGSDIPSGAQTVTVHATSEPLFYAKAPIVITYTAGTDIDLIDVQVQEYFSPVANPQVILNLSSRTAAATLVWVSAHDAVTEVSPRANWTEEFEVDYSLRVAGVYRYDLIDGADITAGISQSQETGALLAVALGTKLVQSFEPARIYTMPSVSRDFSSSMPSRNRKAS
jgi:hypothetical protein